MTKSDRLVSVVIPCFNAENTLVRTVHSVQAQNYENSEILIVDDRSKDRSIKVAHSLAAEFTNIRVLEQRENAGPAATRNLGLRHASGRYVCFLDADDEYAPGFFAKVLPLLEANPELCGVMTGIEIVDCDREVHPVQLKAVISSIPSNLIIRKNIADLLGGFPESPALRGKAAGEDWAFKKALCSYFKVTYCPEKYFRYYFKPGSHLQYFLDRSRVVDDKLVLTEFSSEEESGELSAVFKMYFEQVQKRKSSFDIQQTGPPGAQIAELKIDKQMHKLRFPDSQEMRKTIKDLCSNEYGFPQCLESDTGAILDIGANIGCTALLLRSKFPKTTIYAFEPSQETFKYLQANAGSLPGVHVFNFGLFDRDSEQNLYLGNLSSVTNTIGRSARNSSRFEVVKLKRVSTFLVEQDIQYITLIKLATEGAELPILRDLEPWLKRIDAIAIKYHSEEDRIEIDRLLSAYFLLFRGAIHFPHRGTLVYVSKEVIATRTNLDQFRILLSPC